MRGTTRWAVPLFSLVAGLGEGGNVSGRQDFGKVPVGFQSVANPTLTVTVSGTAANGYQLINRADVGGKASHQRSCR